MQQVLLINGSPHAKGCTYTALENVAIGLHEFGIETEMIQVGHLDIRGCIACGSCAKNGKCVFDDIVNEVAKKFEEKKKAVPLHRNQEINLLRARF